MGPVKLIVTRLAQLTTKGNSTTTIYVMFVCLLTSSHRVS